MTHRAVDFRLDGARAVVTGAGSGIGQGTALALAQAGAQHLIFAVRGVADTSRLERVAADVFPQLR